MSDTPTPTPTAGIPRTLPTAPIPTVAYDEIIDEGWGDSVAQSLNNINESEQWMTWPDDPPSVTWTGNTPTSSTFVTWLELFQIYVPDWAALTIVQTSVEGLTEGTGGPNTVELQLSIGGITSGHTTMVTAPVAAGGRFTVSWGCRIDLSSLSGLQDVELLARRVSGSGSWNLGSAGPPFGVGVFPRYIGAVNWYGT